jgi:hypothetical protein
MNDLNQYLVNANIQMTSDMKLNFIIRCLDELVHEEADHEESMNSGHGAALIAAANLLRVIGGQMTCIRYGVEA